MAARKKATRKARSKANKAAHRKETTRTRKRAAVKGWARKRHVSVKVERSRERKHGPKEAPHEASPQARFSLTPQTSPPSPGGRLCPARLTPSTQTSTLPTQR